MPKEGDPFQLFRDHRVLVVAGAGGVGKTTMSAALAALGASQGRRTLCLTIDPARRLAQAFGVEHYLGREVEVSRQVFEGASLGQGYGSLTLMMLDPRETFDEVVQSGLSSPDVAKRVLSHKVYDHLAQNLAGTQAYMAMEKVCEVADDPKWDLIVLDTPPSARVLDFFDAPAKMAQILDSPATRALVTALRSGRRIQPGLVGVGMRAALAGMERVTGSTMLSDVAELIASMNQLLGGFGERAQRLQSKMNSSDFGYALVTSPDVSVMSDVSELASAMHQRNLTLDALICNRLARGVGVDIADELTFKTVLTLLSELGLSGTQQDRLRAACEHEAVRHKRQHALCRNLLESLSKGTVPPLVSYVPELELSEPGTPDDSRRVWAFAELLRDGFFSNP